MLFAADAHIPQLLSTLNQLYPGEKAPIDLCKVSHHGSKGTVSLEFVEKLDCAKFAFSTNGSLYYHPHREAVARVIHGSGSNPELYFNYKSDENKIWGLIESQYDFKTHYPENDQSGITISVS